MINNVSEKEIVDAINIHWRLQLGSYFKAVNDLSGAFYNLGDKVVDYFWNYAALINTTEKDADRLIDRIIDFAEKNNRVPAIYIDPTVKPSNFRDYIKKKGFKLSGDEIWMFFNPSGFSMKDRPPTLQIKRVETDKEMHSFIDVFDAAYAMGKDGKVYLESLFDAFKKKHKNVEIFHYLGKVDDKPVSIASVYISKDVAGIYNVGTIPSYTKRGLGGALSRIAISEAVKHKVRRLLLQTELESEAERLYLKLGFKPAFSGEIWSLE